MCQNLYKRSLNPRLLPKFRIHYHCVKDQKLITRPDPPTPYPNLTWLFEWLSICLSVIILSQYLDNTPHFKEPLEIINLPQGHGHEHQSLEERPHDDTTVCVLIDSSVNSVSDLKKGPILDFGEDGIL